MTSGGVSRPSSRAGGTARRTSSTAPSSARASTRPAQKGGSDQALGRSRGGLSTKIHAVTDARGRPVDLRLTGGQVSDSVPALDLLEGEFGAAIVADGGYDSDRVVSLVEAQGSRAAIPPRPRRTGRREFDRDPYRLRHRIEFCSDRLKRHRRIATRHEKLAAHYLGMVQLASALVSFEV